MSGKRRLVGDTLIAKIRKSENVLGRRRGPQRGEAVSKLPLLSE